MACELWNRAGEQALEMKLLPFRCWPPACPFQQDPSRPECSGLVMEEYYEGNAELTDCHLLRPILPPTTPPETPPSKPPPDYNIRVIFDPEMSETDPDSLILARSLLDTLRTLSGQNLN